MGIQDTNRPAAFVDLQGKKICKAYERVHAKMRKKAAKPLRHWRDVLQEYQSNAGKRVSVTLPRLKTLEKQDEECERAA